MQFIENTFNIKQKLEIELVNFQLNPEATLDKDASSKSSKGKFEINKDAIPKTWFQKRKTSRIEGIQFLEMLKVKKKIIPSIYISKGSIKPLNHKFPSIFIKDLNY